MGGIRDEYVLDLPELSANCKTDARKRSCSERTNDQLDVRPSPLEFLNPYARKPAHNPPSGPHRVRAVSNRRFTWKRFAGIAACLLLVLSVGGSAYYIFLRINESLHQNAPSPAARPSVSESTASGESPNSLPELNTTAMTETEDVIPAEAVAALEARESKSFWLVRNEDGQIAQEYSYTPMSCFDLWPEIRVLLFSDAEEQKPALSYSDPSENGNSGTVYYLKADNLDLMISVSLEEISIQCDDSDLTQKGGYAIPPETAESYYNILRAYLEQKTGIGFSQAKGRNDILLTSSLLLNSVPIDFTMSNDQACGISCMRLLDGARCIEVKYPISNIQPMGSHALNGPCSVDEVYSLIEQHEAKLSFGEDCTVVTVYRECTLHYVINYKDNRITPVWDIRGIRYFDRYKADPNALYTTAWDVHYIVNGATGKIGTG